jgi:hypothetical protein
LIDIPFSIFEGPDRLARVFEGHFAMWLALVLAAPAALCRGAPPVANPLIRISQRTFFSRFAPSLEFSLRVGSSEAFGGRGKSAVLPGLVLEVEFRDLSPSLLEISLVVRNSGSAVQFPALALFLAFREGVAVAPLPFASGAALDVDGWPVSIIARHSPAVTDADDFWAGPGNSTETADGLSCGWRSIAVAPGASARRTVVVRAGRAEAPALSLARARPAAAGAAAFRGALSHSRPGERMNIYATFSEDPDRLHLVEGPVTARGLELQRYLPRTSDAVTFFAVSEGGVFSEPVQFAARAPRASVQDDPLSVFVDAAISEEGEIQWEGNVSVSASMNLTDEFWDVYLDLSDNGNGNDRVDIARNVSSSTKGVSKTFSFKDLGLFGGTRSFTLIAQKLDGSVSYSCELGERTIKEDRLLVERPGDWSRFRLRHVHDGVSNWLGSSDDGFFPWIRIGTYTYHGLFSPFSLHNLDVTADLTAEENGYKLSYTVTNTGPEVLFDFALQSRQDGESRLTWSYVGAIGLRLKLDQVESHIEIQFADDGEKPSVDTHWIGNEELADNVWSVNVNPTDTVEAEITKLALTWQNRLLARDANVTFAIRVKEVSPSEPEALTINSGEMNGETHTFTGSVTPESPCWILVFIGNNVVHTEYISSSGSFQFTVAPDTISISSNDTALVALVAVNEQGAVSERVTPAGAGITGSKVPSPAPPLPTPNPFSLDQHSLSLTGTDSSLNVSISSNGAPFQNSLPWSVAVSGNGLNEFAGLPVEEHGQYGYLEYQREINSIGEDSRVKEVCFTIRNTAIRPFNFRLAVDGSFVESSGIPSYVRENDYFTGFTLNGHGYELTFLVANCPSVSGSADFWVGRAAGGRWDTAIRRCGFCHAGPELGFHLEM